MVEDIVCLNTQLYIEALGEPQVLERRGIEILLSRATETISRTIPEFRSTWIIGENGCRRRAEETPFKALAARARRTPYVGTNTLRKDRERRSALDGDVGI